MRLWLRMKRKFMFRLSLLVFLWLSWYACATPQAIDLSAFAKKNALNFSIQDKNVVLRNSTHNFKLMIDSKEAILDGTKVFLTYKIEKRKGFFNNSGNKKTRSSRLKNISEKYVISQVDVKKILHPLLFPKSFLKPSGKVIVIDPGHGGKADGAQNKSLHLKEKNLTLQTANLLAQKLKNRGYITYLTRTKDTDVSLEKRTEFANSKKADLFISIHYNAAGSSQASGLEIFAYSFANHPSTDRNTATASDKVLGSVNKFDEANTFLAWNIQNQLRLHLQLPDRGVRHGRMAVLKGLNCPGVLIECGFISNLQEASTLKTNSYQENLTLSICEGIQRYCR